VRHKVRTLEIKIQQLENTIKKADRVIGEINSIKEQLLQLQKEKRRAENKSRLLLSVLIGCNLIWVFVLCICL